MNDFDKNKLTIKLSLSGDIFQSKDYSLLRLEELLKFSYLPFLTYSDWETETYLKKACLSAYRKKKIPQEAVWLGALHSSHLNFQPLPSIAICWINEEIGYGVFCTKLIKKWSFIGEYTGILRKRKLKIFDENDYCFRYPLPKLTLKKFTIDSSEQGNFTRFINHNDNPNMESIGVFYKNSFRVMIRTIRDVPPGEELTYHYGPLYWKNRKGKIR